MNVSFAGWKIVDVLNYIQIKVSERLDGSLPYISTMDVKELMDKDPNGSQVQLFIDDVVDQWSRIPGDPRYGTGDDLCDMRIPEPTGHHTLAEQATVSVSYRAPYRRITRHPRSRSSVSVRTA